MKTTIILFAVLSLVLLVGCEDKVTDPTGAGGFPDIAGIVAFYSFDNTMQDATEGGHDATTGTTGLPFVDDHNENVQQAIFVDGVVDTLWVPDHPELDLVGDVTLAAWIKPQSAVSSYGAVIDKDREVAYSLGITSVTPPDTLAGIKAYIAGVSYSIGDLVPVGVENWTHIAFSFNDASDRGSFYVNGNFVGSVVKTSSPAPSDVNLRMGSTVYGDPYVGALDQVAIIERALSEVEIGLLYGFD